MSKIQPLKMRIMLRGYVTAGQDETVNDSVESTDFRPAPGQPTYAPAASYYLYECVIETCQRK